jgi:hypothetical protein
LPRARRHPGGTRLDRHPKGRKVTVREMAEWLDYRRRVLPPEWCKTHHVDSHDSHEQDRLGMFRKERFGEDAARLLFAWAAFLDGALMSYVGAESGSEEFFRKVLEIRRSAGPLRRGECDYLAIAPSRPEVFAPLWREGRAFAVPVLSFALEPVRVEAAGKPASGTGHDLRTRREIWRGVARGFGPRAARARALPRLLRHAVLDDHSAVNASRGLRVNDARRRGAFAGQRRLVATLNPARRAGVRVPRAWPGGRRVACARLRAPRAAPCW